MIDIILIAIAVGGYFYADYLDDHKRQRHAFAVMLVVCGIVFYVIQ